MKKIFILTAALFLFAMSGFAQIRVWKNNSVTYSTDPSAVDSITFGTPYQCLALNEVCGNEGWIEIYNKSDFKIDLEGIKIIRFDGSGNTETMLTFSSETINDKSYYVKELSSGISNTEDFKIGLEAPDGTVFDVFDVKENLNSQHHANGGSYSRIPDGVGEWKIVSESSKNLMNNYGAAEMPEFPITLIHDKVWSAKYAEFPADEAIYIRTKDGQLEYDYNKGEYVYITAREYGEDYRDKYNAANGTNVTIEDVLRFDYEDGYYYEIKFTDNMECTIWDGASTPYGEVAVMNVSGKYTMDEEKGIIYVKDTESNSLYDKEVEIKITRDENVENGFIFDILKKKVLNPAYDKGFDFDLFGYSFMDYDGTYEYYPAKKILYHCEETEFSRH